MLATAKIAFHVDVNVGDPIWPTPAIVELPRVLGGQPIRVTGYPIEMVMAEKYITAIQRGTANTRWRDFVDLERLARAPHDLPILTESARRVAAHRGVTIRPLHDVLTGYSDIAQQRWTAWRRKQHLEATTPESFNDLLEPILQLQRKSTNEPHRKDTGPAGGGQWHGVVLPVAVDPGEAFVEAGWGAALVVFEVAGEEVEEVHVRAGARGG